MILFECDYNEGAHPQILERLMETNMVQTVGYGCDDYCEKARELIQEACGTANADIHFLVGGTQTNATVIHAALRPFQGALCASSGHINVHETGAVEADGHKVLGLPHVDGKITADAVEAYYQGHIHDESHEHTVMPKMVYVSQPTEYGTLYTKEELTALYEVCQRNHLYFFIDGARLGYGLAASGNDVTLKELASLCDVFYIGGTKLGALFGEAVVITNDDLKPDFRYLIKQKGAMLAKGRLLGLQFLTLFEEDTDGSNLYMKGASHAIKLADQLRKTFIEKNIPFLFSNTTNQIFPVMKDSDLDILRKDYSFSYIERVDESHSAVRFCTSWATQEDAVKQLCETIQNL